jgi:His-Xaa-Ser system protein HxsD
MGEPATMSFNTPVRREDGSVGIDVDTRFFSEEAILKAAYQFTGQCHVKLATVGEGVAQVVISPKDPQDNLDRVVPELLNELIDQQLRITVGRETAEIQRLIIAEAFAPLQAEGGK